MKYLSKKKVLTTSKTCYVSSGTKQGGLGSENLFKFYLNEGLDAIMILLFSSNNVDWFTGAFTFPSNYKGFCG